MADAVAPHVENEAARTIIMDIAAGRPEKDSRLTYTADMRKYRTVVEAEWEAWQKDHPDAELVIPNELPRTDIKVPKSVVRGPAPVTTKESERMAVRFTLTEADRLALKAAGLPVPTPIEEASKSDHFYGAWKGGSGKSGGTPRGGGAGNSLGELQSAFSKAFGGGGHAAVVGLMPKYDLSKPVLVHVYARDKFGRVGEILKEYPNAHAAAKAAGVNTDQLTKMAGKYTDSATLKAAQMASKESAVDLEEAAQSLVDDGLTIVGWKLKFAGGPELTHGRLTTQGTTTDPTDTELGAEPKKVKESTARQFASAYRRARKGGG